MLPQADVSHWLPLAKKKKQDESLKRFNLLVEAKYNLCMASTLMLAIHCKGVGILR